MTLALLPRLQHQIYTVNGIKLAINYGLNRVRFPAPVPVGSRVRAQSSLVGVDDLGNGAVQATVSTTVEIDGSAAGVRGRKHRPLHLLSIAGRRLIRIRNRLSARLSRRRARTLKFRDGVFQAFGQPRLGLGPPGRNVRRRERR